MPERKSDTRKPLEPELKLELGPETQVYIQGHCSNCLGPECPVCKGKGVALAVISVADLVDLAVTGTIEQAELAKRKGPKIMRLH